MAWSIRPLSAAALALALFGAGAASAQTAFQVPRASQHASVSQRIGLTDVSIDYHRPGVKGRKIWGALVPYGEAWRVGANERTKFTVSSDVLVDGKPLSAGSYGLAMIPTADTWTVAFSKVGDAWGTFSYDAKDDALRVTVKPRTAAAPQEWMQFRFESLAADSTEVVLAWENLEVPFKVSVDLDKVAKAKIGEVVRWEYPIQAANFALERGDVEQGLKWANASLALEENFSNLRTKARLLAKKGDTAGAVAAGEKALEVAPGMKTPPPAQALADFRKEVDGWKGGKK